jgi:hypothetical protein
MKKREEASSAFSLFFNFFKCASDFSIEIVRFRRVKEKAWVGNNSSRSISSMSRRYVRDCISCTSSVAVGNKKQNPTETKKRRKNKNGWNRTHHVKTITRNFVCDKIRLLHTEKVGFFYCFLFSSIWKTTKQNFHSIIPKIQKEIEREMGFAHPILFHL